MAETFVVRKPVIKMTIIDPGLEVPNAMIDITDEHVDLLIGRSQYRWNRKNGELISRDDGVKL